MDRGCYQAGLECLFQVFYQTMYIFFFLNTSEADDDE